MNVLYARIEHFGALLYAQESGEYLRVSMEDALAVEVIVKAGAATKASGLLSHFGLGKSYDKLQWIENPRDNDLSLSAPLKVFFNTTKRCSLFCHHCYNDSGYIDSDEIPTPLVVKLLGDMEKQGVFHLTLAGGEPTIHRGFPQILAAIGKSPLKVSMVTNGIGLTDKLIGLISGTKQISSITVSIDGATQYANDVVRGDGVFDRVVSRVSKLRAHYPNKIHLRMTLTRPALNSLDEVPRLLEMTGVNSLKVNRCNPYGRAALRPDLVPDPEENAFAWQKLQSMSHRHDFRIEIPAEKYVLTDKGTLGLCRAGEETAEIDADGHLYPCSFCWGRFSAGNLHKVSFADACLKLQQHSINNAFCMQCRGRGGSDKKPQEHVSRIPVTELPLSAFSNTLSVLK